MSTDSFWVPMAAPRGVPYSHTAAFHGAAHKVLDFLCQSVNASNSQNDGGLANVNLIDADGWTASHFAAGANLVETVQVLVQHGAKLNMEANNGCTPFQWAQPASNNQVAKDSLRQHRQDGCRP
jgi:ankyrin repeat protein